MPLLMILIFGYTFGGDVKGIALEVVNHDTGIPPGSSLLLTDGLFLAQNITQNLDENILTLHTNTDSENARISHKIFLHPS
jgi:hypothetical protein